MHLKRTIKKSLYFFVSKYFLFWSKISLNRWRPRVIVITGSVGKTTLLNLIEVQLGTSAHYSHNANSAFGIAFDIVGLRGITNSRLRWLYLLVMVPIRSLYFTHTQEFYVAEVDSDRPKEAELIAKFLQPEVSLWVSASNSHAVYYDELVSTGAFDSVEEAIAHEFSLIPKHTSKLVVIDGSNDLMKKYTKDIQAEVIRIDPEPQKYSVKVNESSFMIDDTTFNLSFPAPKEISIQLSMLYKLAKYLSQPVKTDLSGFIMPPGRSNYFEGPKAVKIIDSTYNAHLISMESMINMFEQIDESHKWLVIGDMIEQGKSEESEHRKLGKILATTPVDKIILVGRRMTKYTLPELSESVATDVKSFDDTKDAYEYIQNTISGGETILLKGSQYLEWIVEKLLKNPADIARLARQEPAAKKRRLDRGLS